MKKLPAKIAKKKALSLSKDALTVLHEKLDRNEQWIKFLAEKQGVKLPR